MLNNRKLQEADTTGEQQGGFNLDQYIVFEIRRGGEDSAEAKDLNFEVIVTDIEGDKLKFKLRFENTPMISQGAQPDVLIGTIIDESFFCSADSADSIAKGTEIKTVLPQMFGEEFEAAMVSTKSAAETTTQTLMTSQIFLTLILSVSLKQMWNLFNVVQVLALSREFTKWPALGKSVITYIIDAIYLKQIND